MIDINNIPYKEYWLKELGYLDIDLDLLAVNLCNLINFYLKRNYTFQKITVKISTSSNISSNNSKEEKRFLYILSEKEYKDEDFAFLTNKPYIKYYNAPSLFVNNPLAIDSNDFVIAFSQKRLDKILLGCLQDEVFIPTDFNDLANKKEIIFNNPNYYFITNFLKEIMQYKIDNNKPILTEQDMAIILDNLFKSNDLNIRLVNVLKIIEEHSWEAIQNLTLDKILKLKK